MPQSAPAPFVHHRIITWADTDPAGIAYTGRFPGFALEAIDAWFYARIGADWYTLHNQMGGGTPFVHIEMDFRASLRPRDALFTTVTLTKPGRTSLAFAVTGRLDSGQISFTGRFVCVFVESATGRPRPAPAAFAAAIAREAAIGQALASA